MARDTYRAGRKTGTASWVELSNDSRKSWVDFSDAIIKGFSVDVAWKHLGSGSVSFDLMQPKVQELIASCADAVLAAKRHADGLNPEPKLEPGPKALEEFTDGEKNKVIAYIAARAYEARQSAGFTQDVDFSMAAPLTQLAWANFARVAIEGGSFERAVGVLHNCVECFPRPESGLVTLRYAALDNTFTDIIEAYKKMASQEDNRAKILAGGEAPMIASITDDELRKVVFCSIFEDDNGESVGRQWASMTLAYREYTIEQVLLELMVSRANPNRKRTPSWTDVVANNWARVQALELNKKGLESLERDTAEICEVGDNDAIERANELQPENDSSDRFAKLAYETYLAAAVAGNGPAWGEVSQGTRDSWQRFADSIANREGDEGIDHKDVIKAYAAYLECSNRISETFIRNRKAIGHHLGGLVAAAEAVSVQGLRDRAEEPDCYAKIAFETYCKYVLAEDERECWEDIEPSSRVDWGRFASALLDPESHGDITGAYAALILSDREYAALALLTAKANHRCGINAAARMVIKKAADIADSHPSFRALDAVVYKDIARKAYGTYVGYLVQQRTALGKMPRRFAKFDDFSGNDKRAYIGSLEEIHHNLVGPWQGRAEWAPMSAQQFYTDLARDHKGLTWNDLPIEERNAWAMFIDRSRRELEKVIDESNA